MGAVRKTSATQFMLFLVIAAIVLGEFAMLVVYLLVEAGVPQGIFTSLWFVIFLQFFRLLLPVFIWLRFKKESFKSYLPAHKLDIVSYVYIFFLTLLAMPAVMLVSGITTLFVDNSAAELLETLSDAGNPWWLMMLAIAVTPAVVEELVFRGYIQAIQRGTVIKICILNGFLFAIMHLDLHQFAYTFIVGAGWAYLVYITKSIWAGIFSHLIMNGSQVTLMYLSTQGGGGTSEVAGEAQTLAQAMYDAFYYTDPEMAIRMYEFFSNVRPELVAIVIIGIIAIPTTVGAVFVFRAFLGHTRSRKEQHALGVETEIDDKKAEEEAPVKRVDWYLIGVIAIYVLVAVVLR